MPERGEADDEDPQAAHRHLKKKTNEMMKQFKEIHRATGKLLTQSEEALIKEAFTKELPELTRNVAKQQKMIVESFDELAAFSKRLENLLERQQADEERWARLDAQERSMDSLMKDLESRQKADEARWSNLDGQLKAITREEDTLSRLTGRLEVLGGQVAMLEATGDAVAQLTGKVDVMEKNLAALSGSDELAEFRGKIDSVEKLLSGMGGSVDALGELRGRLEGLERTSGRGPAMSESLQATLSSIDSRLKGLEEKELDGRMKVIEIPALDSRIKNLETAGVGGGGSGKDSRELAERLGLLEERSNAKDTDVAVLGEKVGHLEEASRKLEETRGLVQTTREIAGGLENKVSAVAEEMSRIEELVAKLESLGPEVAQVADRVKELDAVHGRMDALAAKLDGASKGSESLVEVQRRLDALTGAETELTRKVTEIESLAVPKLMAQVASAIERSESMEHSVETRLEEELERSRSDAEMRVSRLEKSVKDRDERLEEMDSKVAQLELDRDRVTALDELVKKRLLPDPAVPRMQDSVLRVERRLDALSEEGAVTSRQIEEERSKLNRAIDRIARMEATPPGALAKQEFAAQEIRLAALEEASVKLQKDMKAQREQLMLVLEDLESMRPVPGR